VIKDIPWSYEFKLTFKIVLKVFGDCSLTDNDQF